jgi:cell division protein FtsI (penicillin-binding protein 3)
MRMAIQIKAKKADIPGYQVFGKTGTAYLAKGGSYHNGKSRTNTFIGAFPYNNPQYIMIVVLEDPKPNKSTYGYNTAGWNSAPTGGKMIARMAPILGLHINDDDDESFDNNGHSQEWTHVNHIVSSPGLIHAGD